MITLDELRQIEDPRALFDSATEAIAAFRLAMDHAATIRARALAALAAEGYSHRDLAVTLDLSQPRVSQILSATDKPVVEVLKAWVSIERLLTQVVGAAAAKTRGSVYARAIRILRASGKFDPETLDQVDTLRTTRNRIVHGQMDVSADTAERFLNLATVFNARLVLWMREVDAPADITGSSQDWDLMSDLASSVEVERRHEELGPEALISFEREANQRTGMIQAWVRISNMTDRAYVMRVRGHWGADSYSELGVRQLEPRGEVRVFVSNSAENPPAYISVAYEAAGWSCPCGRPKEMHWIDNRKFDAELRGPGAILRMRFQKVGRSERLVVQNLGTSSAKDVTITLEPVGGGEAPFVNGNVVGHLPPQSEFSFIAARSMATAGQVNVTFDWLEGDEPFTETQSVSLV